MTWYSTNYYVVNVDTLFPPRCRRDVIPGHPVSGKSSEDIHAEGGQTT